MAEKTEMLTANGESIKLKQYQDVLFPDLDGLDPQWGVEHANNFKCKPGDMLFCVYPKCGTHWIANMALKLRYGDDSERPIDTFVEYGPAEVYEALESPRFIFTHFKPKHLPPEHIKNGGKIVLTLRNSKDVMVSRYHHLKNAVLFKNKLNWKEFFDRYINGVIAFGSYFDYVQQWDEFLKKEQGHDQVHIFYYEEMKADIDVNLARLNSFLGLGRDQAYVDRVNEETTLSALKARDAAGQRGTHSTVQDEHGDSVIYRKGEVGDWKNYLTVAQSEAVDRMLAQRLENGMINIKYEI